MREARILFSTTSSSTSSKDRSKPGRPDGVAIAATSRAARHALVAPQPAAAALLVHLPGVTPVLHLALRSGLGHQRGEELHEGLVHPDSPVHKPSTMRSRTCLASLRWGWRGAVGMCITRY